MLGDTGNLSLILGERSIMDWDDLFPTCFELAVEVERGGNFALEKVENGHSAIGFYSEQVNAWSTCADIDHRIVELYALGKEKSTCLICASTTCQIFTLPSSPAEMAKEGLGANETL